MIGQGLSLDQSPPFAATARFFLTAPIFIVIAGLILLIFDIELTRSDLTIVALTHTLTLGVLTMVIFGALQQMLPVLAGVKIKYANFISSTGHAFLVIGTLSYAFSFTQFLPKWSVYLSSISLFLAFFLVLGSALFALTKAIDFSPTVKAMLIASVGGLLTSSMGVWLLSDYVGSFNGMHSTIMKIHMACGVFGFATVLIIGVSFRIIPMFYVAPEFKKEIKNWMNWSIALSLILWTFTQIIYPLSLVCIIYGFSTLRKMYQRRRSISDVTVWYWKLGSIGLISGAITLSINVVTEKDLDLYTGILLGGVFLLSTINGMLYKIVPFLVWFHLNAKGLFDIPTMREMLNKKVAKIQFFFHLGSLIFLAFGPVSYIYIKLAALCFITSGCLMFYNLLCAVKVYRDN